MPAIHAVDALAEVETRKASHGGGCPASANVPFHESINHYSKGAVISFLHRYVAGLQRLEPTWRRFRAEPMPRGGLTSASTF